VVQLLGIYHLKIIQKVRNNETHYRTSGDIVSLLNANSKHTKTLKNENIQTGILPIDTYNAQCR
jgi:hypothetical protein